MFKFCKKEKYMPKVATKAGRKGKGKSILQIFIKPDKESDK